MSKAVFALVALVALVVGGFFWLNSSPYQEKQGKSAGEDSYKDLTYMIEGKPVQLRDGYAEENPPVGGALGSASKTITRYFGNEAVGDIDGDGVADVAFLLTQEGGGSGTFFYAAAALRKGDGYLSVDATIVGDRVAPQTTEIRDGLVIVNYAERKAGEPMTARPSMGKSLYL